MQIRVILAGAALLAASAVGAAQTAGQQGPAGLNSENLNSEQQAAPIERAYPNQNGYAGAPSAAPAANQAANQTTVPIQGVMLRVSPQTRIEQVSNPSAEGSDSEKFELRVDRGVVNINVHDPGKDKLILVDLPGGQAQLLKNGLYTFNAETNTVRVLKGEALAFPADAAPEAKPLKVKEYNKVVFNGTNVKPHEFVPYEASVDLLSGPQGPRGDGEVYGYGPHGDGFYGYAPYPYYGYATPWGWGDPYYSWGYPYPYGVGLGFGYVGGFGGFHGGFHGGGFHGGGFGGGHRGR